MIRLDQLWFFWIVPIVGGVLGALAYNAVAGSDTDG